MTTNYNQISLYTKPWLIPGFLIRLDKFPLLSNRALVLLYSIYVLLSRRPMNSEEQPNLIKSCSSLHPSAKKSTRLSFKTVATTR